MKQGLHFYWDGDRMTVNMVSHHSMKESVDSVLFIVAGLDLVLGLLLQLLLHGRSQVEQV